MVGESFPFLDFDSFCAGSAELQKKCSYRLASNARLDFPGQQPKIWRFGKAFALHPLNNTMKKTKIGMGEE